MIVSGKKWTIGFLAGAIACGSLSRAQNPAPRVRETQAAPDVFIKSNLLAWCIVPFDSKKRGPVARAQMLNKLGITKFAYDWRANYIPTFDAEIDAIRSHHIQLVGFWMMAGKDPAHDPNVQVVLDLLRRRYLKTELWVMYTPDKDFSSLTQQEKIAQVSKTISYLASEARKTGSSVGLYNHAGWYGEPENELAILRAVKETNVGMVYNFNHAQNQIQQFTIFFPKILPHLMAVNLGGLRQGDPGNFPLGQGGSAQKMISIVWKSGYHGPIGIINETTAPDAEVGLKMNIDGLEHILAKIGDTRALATYK
jgi:sugar phosphate isomerase/epimerase